MYVCMYLFWQCNAKCRVVNHYNSNARYTLLSPSDMWPLAETLNRQEPVYPGRLGVWPQHPWWCPVSWPVTPLSVSRRPSLHHEAADHHPGADHSDHSHQGRGGGVSGLWVPGERWGQSVNKIRKHKVTQTLKGPSKWSQSWWTGRLSTSQMWLAHPPKIRNLRPARFYVKWVLRHFQLKCLF